MADFNDNLSSLVSLAVAGRNVKDPTKMSEIMERLAHSLAFTIALAAQGDPKGINELLEGMTAYMFQAAAEQAPLAKMITRATARS